MEQNSNNKSVGERISQLQKEGYALDSDEVRDVIEEDVFKDDKEALEDIRLKIVLKEKVKKGLLSEKEIDNLIGTMLGTDNLRKDEDNQIDVKKAEINIEGIKRSKEYMQNKLKQYDSYETDEEREQFLNNLKNKVNSPEVSEKNTQEREQRERNIQTIEKQDISNTIPIQEPKTIE